VSERGGAQAGAVIRALAGGATMTTALVNEYYALCIPFYREFLGEHWHTGWYEAQGPIGPQDQLRMERVVAHSAGIGAGSRVLDVGCGIGGPACHIAHSSGAQVLGITPNTEQLRIARAAAQARGLAGQVRFELGDAAKLPCDDASCDAVLFFESACHFPDRLAFFAEAARVLRPGGYLAGEDWLMRQACEPALRDAWAQRVCTTWAIPELGTVDSYARGMRAAGLQVELARDMREEMAVQRGFVTAPADRAAILEEAGRTADPIRRWIMQAVAVLGEATECGAFTLGRFVARKPALRER
jgi:ubiquinone/menaquinone biosynthesis C-methylase UbiE